MRDRSRSESWVRALVAKSRNWRSEVKAVGWLFGADTGARVVGQVAIIVTARVLGPEDYGSLAVAIAVFSIAVVFADGGVGDASVQKLSRRPAGARIFWSQVAPLRIYLSLLFLPAGLVLAALSSDITLRLSGIVLAAVPLAIIISNRILAARISEEFPTAAAWASALSLSQWIGALVGALLFAVTFSAVLGMVFLLFAAACIAFRPISARPPLRRQAKLWSISGLPFLMTAGTIALYTRGDRIVVGIIVGAGAAGTYSAAYSVIMVMLIAGAALHSAVLPRLLQEDKENASPRWHIRAGLLALVAIPSAVALWIIAPWLMTTVYGDSFADAGRVLRVLSPLVVFYLVNPFLTSCLVGARKQQSVAIVALANLGLAVLAYPLLTHAFGEIGTAWASVCIEVLGFGLTVLFLRRASGRGRLRVA